MEDCLLGRAEAHRDALCRISLGVTQAAGLMGGVCGGRNRLRILWRASGSGGGHVCLSESLACLAVSVDGGGGIGSRMRNFVLDRLQGRRGSAAEADAARKVRAHSRIV